MRITAPSLNPVNGQRSPIVPDQRYPALQLGHFWRILPEKSLAHFDISPASWKDALHDLGPAGATGTLVDSLRRYLADPKDENRETAKSLNPTPPLAIMGCGGLIMLVMGIIAIPALWELGLAAFWIPIMPMIFLLGLIMFIIGFIWYRIRN